MIIKIENQELDKYIEEDRTCSNLRLNSKSLIEIDQFSSN